MPCFCFMPITILHFGLLAPIRHFFPGKVSLFSFTWVSLWMDGNAILHYLFGLPGEFHGLNHTMAGALLIASIVWVVQPYPFTKEGLPWTLGAFLGAISHVLLDMLVHPELEPLFPIEGNPFYKGWMEPLSLILVPLTVWFICQNVSDTLDYVHKHWVDWKAQTTKPSDEEH